MAFPRKTPAAKVRHSFFKGLRGFVMAKDAFDRWWEWVEKPVDSPLTIPDYFREAVMRLSP
jgi:hypothetical protein